MGMKFTTDLSQELRHEMRLVQAIEFANLIAFPDEVLNIVAGAVALNPSSIEGLLEGERKDRANGPEKVQTIYSSLSPSSASAPEKRGMGMIVSPDIRTLEEHIGSYNVETTPDVTYVERKSGKPEVIFSDHIKGTMGMLVLPIDPTKYPNSAKLLRQLRNFDTWKRTQLRESYLTMGDAQREFFESFDNTKLHLFLQKDVAEKLNLAVGTISRILSNRWIEARDISGNQKVMYAKDLFATKDNILRYNVLPILNKIFAQEFIYGKSNSDREIAEMTQGRIAIRTVSKYREGSGVPNASVRKREYLCGQRSEPFVII